MRASLVVLVLCVAACSAKAPPEIRYVSDVPVGQDAAITDAKQDASTADPFAGAPPAICRKPAAWTDQKVYEDVTEAVGVSPKGLATTGVRLSTADLNGDNYPELFARRMILGTREAFVPGQQNITLLKNMAASGTWTFTDMTKESGILQTRDGKDGRPAHIVVYGDVDNDGDLDAFAGAQISEDPAVDVTKTDSSELMLNDGKGHFSFAPTQVFAQADLRRSLSSASFTDYDRDGKLDLWLGYTTWGKNGFPIPSQLMQGAGTGDFTTATTAEGVMTKDWKYQADVEAGTVHRHTWGVAACDMNGDGDPDLLGVSYGRYFNSFWLNGKLGDSGNRFDDLKDFSHLDRDDNDDWTTNWNAQCYCHDNPTAAECGKCPKPVVDCVQLKAAFGGTYRWSHDTDRKPWRLGGNTGTAICADLDGDGDLDLVETTIVHPDVGPSSDPTRIILNDGNPVPVFTHLKGKDTGLRHTFSGGEQDVGDMTGAVFDFDNDGRLDILIASSDYPGTHAMLFHQNAQGTFDEVPINLGIDHMHAHGVAVADFDRDGDLDVALGHSLMRCNLSPEECQPTEQIHVFRNVFGQGGNYLQLQLVGTGGSNRSAIGARVWVTAGGVTQMQELGGGYGHYGMQQDTVLHFGLGANCAIDEVKVRWPDGSLTVQKWNNVRANYLVRLTQGEATPGYPMVK